MTDTWLTYGDAIKRAELKPDLKDYPKPSGRIGGGIGILFNTGIRCKVLSSSELSSFENGYYELLFEKTKLDVHVIYRPPYTEKNILSLLLLLLSLRNFKPICRMQLRPLIPS